MTPTGRVKTCPACLRTLAATPDLFHRQARGKYGLTSKCKACKNEQIKSWVTSHPDEHKAHKVKWRTVNRESAVE